MGRVRCGSANQANSAFHPFGVGKWVVIYVITWTTRVETIKRQTRAVYGSLVAGSKSHGRGLSLQPIRCTPALSVTQQRRCSCTCILWRYISIMPLHFFTFYNPKFGLLVVRFFIDSHPVGVLARWSQTKTTETFDCCDPHNISTAVLFSDCSTDLMAPDRSLDLFAHRFLCYSSNFFPSKLFRRAADYVGQLSGQLWGALQNSD